MEALEEAEHITELNKKPYGKKNVSSIIFFYYYKCIIIIIDERNESEKPEIKEEQNYEESVEKMDFDESSS